MAQSFRLENFTGTWNSHKLRENIKSKASFRVKLLKTYVKNKQ